jgi:hypothetical protein
MATTTTDPLFVTTPSPLPADQILFTITSPAPSSPLFLGFIQINGRSVPASGVIGTLVPDADDSVESPSFHVFRMGNKFAQIHQFLEEHGGPIAIVITYDPVTLKAYDLNPIEMMLAAAANG